MTRRHFARVILLFESCRWSTSSEPFTDIKCTLPVAAKDTSAQVKAAGKPGAITVTIVSAAGGKPVPNAMVVAFTDFASRAGAQGKTNARGNVALALGE